MLCSHLKRRLERLPEPGQGGLPEGGVNGSPPYPPFPFYRENFI
jgi:hypothetical protein